MKKITWKRKKRRKTERALAPLKIVHRWILPAGSLAGGSAGGAANTGSVSVFDNAHNASTRSITAHTAFFSSMSGLTIVDTSRTCNIWGCILRILPEL